MESCFQARVLAAAPLLSRTATVLVLQGRVTDTSGPRACDTCPWYADRTALFRRLGETWVPDF